MTAEFRYDENEMKEVASKALNDYYAALLEKIDNLDLRDVLKKKNPYLYRAKGMEKAADIVAALVDAYISSSEETIFGNSFFEPIAIAASGGRKSKAEGLDLEIDLEGNLSYAIAVKSGTAAYNDSSKKKQKADFESAISRGMQGNVLVKPIIGYGYGRKTPKKAKIYQEVAGQVFWELITGDPDFYKKLIDYMGDAPEENRKKFKRSINKTKNRFTAEFVRDFCDSGGAIDWDRLVQFNSGKDGLKLSRRSKKTTTTNKRSAIKKTK